MYARCMRDAIYTGAYKGPFGRDAESHPPGSKWRTGPYVPALVRDFPAPVQSSADVPDAVDVYRRALAAAADHSVASEPRVGLNPQPLKARGIAKG